jgi:hypothetical protein
MPNDDPVGAANDLAASLREMTSQFAALKTYGHTNRRLIWITIASVILDVTLSVAVIVIAARQAHSNAEFQRSAASAAELRATNLASCENATQSRALQRNIWDTLLTSPVAAKQPPAELARLKREVALAYPPRNCQKIYGGK